VNQPKDYKFKIVDYGADYDQPIFEFYHNDPDDAEAWDDLDEIILRELKIDDCYWLIRLTEGSYEQQIEEREDDIKDALLKLGFKEK